MAFALRIWALLHKLVRRRAGRAFLCLCLFLAFASALTYKCRAEPSSYQTDDMLKEFEELLPDEFKDRLTDDSSLMDAVGFEALFGEIVSAVLGEGSRIVSFFLFLFGCSVLLSVLSLIEGKYKNICCAASGAVVALAVYNNLVPVVGEVAEALSAATDFFSSVSATLTAATVAGGGNSYASVGAVGMGMSVSAIGGISEKMLMGLVVAMFSLSVISSFSDGAAGAVSRCVRSIFMWGIGVITALFAATLSLQGIVAGASDSAAMRAAKYAASGMIPVVGGAVSGALSTLASGVSYVKSIMGAASVAVLMTILLSPLVMLLLYKLTFFLCNLFLELTGAELAGGIIRGMSGALDALISVYALSGAAYVFQIVLFVKGGVALL